MKTYTQPGSRFKKKSKLSSPRLISIHEIVKASSRNRYDPGGDEEKPIKKQKVNNVKRSHKSTKKRIVYSAADDSEDSSSNYEDKKSYVLKKKKIYHILLTSKLKTSFEVASRSKYDHNLFSYFRYLPK